MIRRPARMGFSLVEVLVAVVLVTVAVIGTISSLLFIRETLDVDKQRLIAINHARQQMEVARRNLYPSLGFDSTILIDNFNTPTVTADDVTAELSTQAWVIETDGSLTEVTTQNQLEDGRMLLLQVEIEWNRGAGRRSETREREVLQTYVSPR
jgi:type II secretory pathway pseudopilin PulG